MKTLIHPAGKGIALTGILIYLIAYALVAFTAGITWLSTAIGIFLFFIVLFLFYFFRNPTRNFTIDNQIVISPADGTIIAIEPAFEKECLNQECMKISIFMSITNVHANRYPISGTVRYTKMHPGKYFIASYPKASEFNEHCSTVIETPEGISILVKQIAGTVARRIVCYAKEGEKVTQGTDIGFIKFGSRVDLFLPLNTEILVKRGEKVKGSRTAIARLNNSTLFAEMNRKMF